MSGSRRRRDYSQLEPSTRVLRSNPAASTRLVGYLPYPTRPRRTPVVPILETWNLNASRSSTSASHSEGSGRLSLNPTLSLSSAASMVSLDMPEIAARRSIASEWAPSRPSSRLSSRLSSSSHPTPSATSNPSMLDGCVPIDDVEPHFMLRTPTGEDILSSFVKMIESNDEYDKQCIVCTDLLYDDGFTALAILQCPHYLHYECLYAFNGKENNPLCPTCRKEVDHNQHHV